MKTIQKFINFAKKIINNLFKKTTQMTDSRQKMNDYNDAIELAPVLDANVQAAELALKPYQDALDAAKKAQANNIELSKNLKAQIISSLVPVTSIPVENTQSILGVNGVTN